MVSSAVVILTVGAGGASTLTVTESDAVPPAPEHVSTKVVAWVSAPVVAVPSTEREPVQPLLAVHESALVDAQDNVVEAPKSTLAVVAEIDTIGAFG